MPPKKANKFSICTLCSEDETDQMVQCDLCDKWYHFDCVGVNGSVADASWSCAVCRDSQSLAATTSSDAPPTLQNIGHMSGFALHPQSSSPISALDRPPAISEILERSHAASSQGMHKTIQRIVGGFSSTSFGSVTPPSTLISTFSEQQSTVSYIPSCTTALYTNAPQISSTYVPYTNMYTHTPTMITWAANCNSATNSLRMTAEPATASQHFPQQMTGKPATFSNHTEVSIRQRELQLEMLEEEKKLQLEMLEEEKKLQQRCLEKKYQILFSAGGHTSTPTNFHFGSPETGTNFTSWPSQTQIAARKAIPKELPTFHGDPEEWPLFVSSFENSTELGGYSNAENLMRLQACLKGKAREIVRNKLFLPRLVPDIMKTLKMYFGRPEQIIECMIDKARKQPPPKDKLESIIEFALSVSNICSTMEACQMYTHLSNPMLVKEFVDKLPSHHKLNWAMHPKDDRVPVVKEFSSWLENIAEAASQVVSPFPQKKSGVMNTHTEVQLSSGKITCAACKGMGHKISQCDVFKTMSYNQKWETVKTNKLCRQCLNLHRRKCYTNNQCGVQGCIAKHHPLMHKPTEPVSHMRNQVSDHMNVNTHSEVDEGQKPCFRIVPIRVYSENSSKDTFAFLDEGSSVTLMERHIFDSLDMAGVNEPLCLRWTGDTTRIEDSSMRTSFKISAQKNGAKHLLNNVHTVKNLSLPMQSLDMNTIAQRYPYLADLPIGSYQNVRPTILIGLDNWKLAVPLKVREGSGNQPIATKTRLGWALQGNLSNHQQTCHLNVHSCDCVSRLDELHEEMKAFFALESSTTSICSDEDKRALSILTSTCKPLKDGYEIGLLWRYENPTMPNSYKTAVNRLMCLHNKFKREPMLKSKMQAEIDNLLAKGYARKLTAKEAEAISNPVWYLPIFVTVNPNKPNRVRLVWDAAAKSNGYSLNDFMLSGPDLLTSLVEILLAFRVGKVAICGDIAEMFHRIKVREEDMHVQRFLWWDETDLPQQPSSYVMSALTFGMNCAPCIAHYIRNRNADLFENRYARAVEAIKKYHYVDDFIDSVDSSEDALRLAKQVKKIHSSAGFEIRNWVSNSTWVLDQLDINGSEAQRHKALGCPEKILGMYWDPNNDVFKYVFRFARLKRNVLDEQVKPTKRETLQVLMSVFDPLGFIACYTIGLKILLQEVWRSGIGWDDDLPDDVFSKWLQWKSLISEIKSIEIPRCYSGPLAVAENVQIHTFVDAGEYAYAAVCYLRIRCGDQVSISLVASKSKVAPLKPVSIPRLELQAAVLGLRLAAKITAVRRIPTNRKIFWSDSKTVLKWLRMDPRKLQQFVMFRVGEILVHSDVNDWKWVPSKQNTADLATKVSSKLDVQTWFAGPAFLLNEPTDWPTCDDLADTTTPPEDVRVCENRLEDYASGVTLEINDYFLDLHNFLQIEERRILDEFKVLARSSQKSIHEACVKLSDAQTVLNNMRSSMEGFLHKPPHNVHINALIECATTQMEQLPCQIQISEVKTNPFVFKKLKDVRKEISKSYSVIGIDPKICIRITPMYGDHSSSFEISSEEIALTEDTIPQIKSVADIPLMSVSSSSTVAIGKGKRDGRITNIISPSQFYVQNEDALSNVLKHMSKIDENSFHVELVNTGEMYAVYQVGKISWLRGVVKGEVKKLKGSNDIENMKYKVFFIDYGTEDDIHKSQLRMIEENVKSIPAAAFACRLTDIAPADGQWSQEARDLMEEIIQNKPVQVSINDTTKSPWSVDVVTLNYAEPISIREAFLYTGLAIDISATSSERSSKFAGSKPTQFSKIKQRLSRQVLSPGEIFRVNITHVENPQQFFVIKFAQLEELTKLESDMEMEYSGKKQLNTIYYAQLHMCCAICVEGKWYRGCVEEINGPSSIRIRLVDNGRSVIVGWRQLRVLKDHFTAIRELSIECSLADIEPLQANNYEWTDTAIAEFLRMTLNPNIQMTISTGSQFRYLVILNVVKKHLDVNIGAMLVKFKHALSTGDGSAFNENIRGSNVSPLDPLLMPAKDALKKSSAANTAMRTLKRTPIQVIHIVDPGEFYIHLVEHIPGILQFQEELQISKEMNSESENLVANIEWNVNDNCLILTSLSECAVKQWYRGVIKSINIDEIKTRYDVFLRDRGLLIQNAKKEKLAPINDVFKRVANAAILCHLACVHPTGGMKKWSHSAIDQFTHNVHSFESIGATIQGATKDSSIPVVLWGTLTETNDPLGPCTPKYTNINKVLVCTGLAHLTEKIDITRQLDQFVQTEIEKGEQSLQDWYDNFKKALEEIPTILDASNDGESNHSHIANLDDICDIIEDPEIATEWLPAEPIQKTVFTAYPTYLDDDAIVYMHDAEKHSLLLKMREKINELVDKKPPATKTEDEKWIVGQPCLARYHLDRFLYRAVIHRLLPDKKYTVIFVDYGNIEICEARDLLRTMAFPNIPIQAARFTIDGIAPMGGQKKFDTPILDLIHGVIVDKLCAIRVADGEENNEIKKCSIRFDRNDLANYLIQNGLARGVGMKKLEKKSKQLQPLPIESPKEVKHNESSNSEEELREFIKHKICDPTGGDEEIPPPTSEQKKSTAMFHPDEYKRMFEKMQTDKLYQSIAEGDAEMFAALENSSNSEADDEDVVELEFSFRSNYWHVDDNTEGAPLAPLSSVGSNFENFDPCDTSSLLSNFSGIEAFKAPQLPLSVKSFYCEVSYARSSTILHIFPHFTELEYRQLELARSIKLMISKVPPLEVFEMKTPCLARYSKDKHWYRAIIRSHNAPVKMVKVFYVDFLNSELVKEEHVRKCPKELLTWPLRTFEMKLYGIVPNPHLREKDVKQALKKCLSGRKLYARIIMDKQLTKMPEISLFKNETEKKVPVYSDLIEQNFFCER